MRLHLARVLVLAAVPALMGLTGAGLTVLTAAPAGAVTAPAVMTDPVYCPTWHIINGICIFDRTD